MKIDRLLNILMILINRKKVTAKELAEYFEVSIRTIQRDMDSLSMAGIPIYADVGKQGGYQLVDDYKLDKNFLNTSEAKILVTFLDNLKKVVPYSDVKSISDKFSALLPDKSDEEEKIVINLNPSVDNANFRQCLERISQAVDHYKKIHIKYLDSNFTKTDRNICPYTLVMMGTSWYVYGYCDLRQEFRLFKLSRIISCSILNEKFIKVDRPKILPWNNGLDGGRESTKIILEVDKELQGKLLDYFDYRDCMIEEDKIIVNLSFPVDEWLYSLLMGLVPHVRIIEPTWLKEEFVNRLQLGIKKQIMT